MVKCPHDSQNFVNEEELQEHILQVHAEKWEGSIDFSAAGDEGADGAVSSQTADTIATDGGTNRPNARERARRDQS